ncbi:hypothetical protein [Lactiplantibacillus paraplantarum]|uniref:hypothetical protein n=1 Tax=Lactiplantibacillus paraplantarum TaxID=60520 RepID=UPI002551DD68|nr:hypothetical protein [Lactiplantibacillus paraplantarum]MDL2061537.1 hypothetical protein [Lactiplantibacillus paraplantarum]
MKMTTKIKQRYFEFSPRTGADYYALIGAKDKQEAINTYCRDVSEESNLDCKELSSVVAWKKCQSCDDVEGDLDIEERLAVFEDSGVILWPMELIQ